MFDIRGRCGPDPWTLVEVGGAAGQRRPGPGLTLPAGPYPLPMAVAETIPRLPLVPRVRRPPRANPGPVLAAGVGLVALAVSFVGSRTGRSGWPGLLFWVGCVTVLGPVAFRLLSRRAPRAERIGLVVLLGVVMYGVKVLHDPLRFMISDEFIHLVTAQHIQARHLLFTATSVQGGAVSASYPGLEALTVGLADVCGLSLFVSALIVVGLARALMMVAIYQFAEHVTASERVAGVAALLFAANANFLFFSAQFSYESLAFPLFMSAVVVQVARSQSPVARKGLTATLIALIAALTVTHHLTTYALAVVLWLFTLLSLRPEWRSARALGPALLATGAATAWFLLVATGTASYLRLILDRTTSGITALVAGAGTRVPFQSSGSPSLASPLAERVIAYLALMILGIALLAMLLRFRATHLLRTAAGALAILASLGYLALYPLRASPSAWESANRGQEILFAGAGVLLALAVTWFADSGLGRTLGRRLTRGRSPARRWSRRRVVASASVVVVVCGGIVSGWPYALELPPPLEVRASSGQVLVPQGLDMASWAMRRLGPDATYAADVASGRELAVAGARMTYLSGNGTIQELLHARTLPAWEQQFLRSARIGYVVVDRRQISDNNLAGYAFPPRTDPSGGAGYYPAAATAKFAAAGASEIFSSGDIAVFDVSGLWRPAPSCAAIGRASAAAGLTCRSGATLVTFAAPDGVAVLPGLGLRLVSARAAESSGRLSAVFLVQIQNRGRRAVVVDFDRRSFTVTGRDGRTLHAAGFGGLRTVVPAHGSAAHDVSFTLTDPAAIAAARDRGVLLGYSPTASPGAGGPGRRVIVTVAPLARSAR